MFSLQTLLTKQMKSQKDHTITQIVLY